MFNNFAKLRHPLAIDPEKFSDRKKRMYQFLTENPVGVLSTLTPDGMPHGVVIYFVASKDFVVSFLTKTGTRKYDNLIHNGRVQLTVFEPSTQAVVQLSGYAKEVADSVSINAIAGSILGVTQRAGQPGPSPLTKLEEGHFTAFNIKPYQVRMAVYARPDSGSYGDIFESVESFELEDEQSEFESD